MPVILLMIVQNSGTLRQIIRYEEQLKATSQKIEMIILDNNPQELPGLRELIAEEEQLIKYLQVETTRLNPQSKQIYMRNMTRFKKKAKQHRDYISATHGRVILPPQSQEAAFMEKQKHQAYLAQNKLVMYENQRIQDGMAYQLQDQGDRLYGGIERNRQIRREADDAQGAIKLIQLSIMKRKIMFSSLVGLFLISLIVAIIAKNNK